MTKQTVVRTRPKEKSYKWQYSAFKDLDTYLSSGYIVVMCNPIGEELEYILEKEIQ